MMRLNFFQGICLGLGAASFMLSAVVYGQLAASNQGSCLVVSLQNSSSAKPQNVIKAIQAVSVQVFNHNNIPLQISYVRLNEQFEAPNNFFGETQAPTQLDDSSNAPTALPEEENKNAIQFQALYSPPETATVAVNQAPTNAEIPLEKPILRNPSINH